MIASKHLTRGRITRWLVTTVVCAGGLAFLTGCPKPQPPPKPMIRWPVIGADPKLPTFLKGSIKELTVTQNTGSFPMSSWGLITELRRTGDTTAPSVVREWMLKEMARHGLGLASLGYQNISR